MTELDKHIKSTHPRVVAWATLDSSLETNVIRGTNNSPPPAPKKPLINPDNAPTHISPKHLTISFPFEFFTYLVLEKTWSIITILSTNYCSFYIYFFLKRLILWELYIIINLFNYIMGRYVWKRKDY